MVIASWCFGGNVRWAETLIIALGLGGLVITSLEFWRRRSGEGSLKPFHWLWPLAGLALLVAFGSLQPSLRPESIEGATVYVPGAVNPSLPSSARPDLAWRAFGWFVAVFIPAFNLVIAVRSRRALRGLWWTIFINAVALAIFGSLQKLAHATGLFFGATPSPNTRFFASFIYQNHWGAFAVLSLTIGLALVSRGADEGRHRDFFHSPAFLALIGALIIAASTPLSASRSCTVMSVLVLAVGALHAVKQRSEARARGRSALAIGFAAALACVAAVWLAKPFIQERLADTQEQLSRMRASGSIGARAQLYTDTWRMAEDRLLFGWGWASYPAIFERYNRQVSTDRLPVYYEDAHSDWLQSVAEVGLVGTTLRGLLLILPLVGLVQSGVSPRSLSAFTAYPLFGCVLILLYAAVEFPFGNVAVTLLFWMTFFSALRLAQLDARENRSASA